MDSIVWFSIIIAMTAYIVHRLRIAPKAGEKILRQSKYLLFIGSGCSAFFALIMTIINLTQGMQLLYLCVFGGFALLGYAMLLAYANWRIEFGEDSFSYYTFLGNKYEYRYEDILEYKQGVDTYILYMHDGKKLYIEGTDGYILGELLKIAKKKRWHGKQIAAKKITFFGLEMKARRRLNAIILLILFIFSTAGGAALILFMNTDAPFNFDNCEQISIPFAAFNREGGRHSYYSISATDGTGYHLNSINYRAFKQDDFTLKVQVGDILTLLVEKNDADSEGRPYIVGIRDTQQIYLSMADSNRCYIDNAILGKWLGLTLLVFGVWGFFMVIYLIKHPTRCPRLQKEFFGEKYKFSR